MLKKGLPGTVSVHATISDTESISFANQLKKTLQEAGWRLKAEFVGLASYNFKGIVIQAEKADNVPAVLLQEALEAIGFPASGEITGGLGNNIIIVVGSKP